MINIFNFYNEIASYHVAQNIINKIVDKTILLIEQPYIGQIEESLVDMEFEYRYLIESNYKIIYRIETSIVIISSVFDCRQNPDKLKDIIKN